MAKPKKNCEQEEIKPPQAVLSQSWRELRVDDRIRIVKMPWDADLPGYTFHSDTRRLYKKLIARRRSLRVFKVDKYGSPWIHCKFRLKNGLFEYHWLALNDDSWVRVKRRGKSK
jgi:hypothetical protein